ncbi:histidinol-phosphate transaminase [Streptomyces sp. NPDC002520]
MTPRPRREVLRLPAYGSGRAGAEPTHRLGSNESPFAPSAAVRAAIAASAGAAHRYPPLRPAALETRLADHLGVDPEQVLVGGGSIAVLEQLVRAFAGPGDRVAYAWRSYEAYPIVIGAAGASPLEVPLHDAALDLTALAAALTPQVRMVVVCNPNNPTSTVLPPGALAEFVAAVPDDVLVLVDEAYREFVPAGATDDGVRLRRAHPNVAVLRTFSKAYGLAGLRVGYCVADAAVVDAARRVALPFTLSAPALAAALTALDEPDLTAQRVRRLTGARDRLVAQVRASGLDVTDSGTNFVWLPLRGDAATEFGQRCAHAGIGVRVFPGEGVRITVGDEAANAAVIAAARQWSSSCAQTMSPRVATRATSVRRNP